MRELFETLLRRLDNGENVVLCSVLSAAGSTPRGAGARMAVFADGTAAGTIGGGAVEKLATEEAVRMHQTRQGGSKRFCLAPNQKADIGMICGGEVTVCFQYLSASDEERKAVYRAAVEEMQEGISAWLILELEGGSVVRTALYDERGGLRFGGALTAEALMPFFKSVPVLTPGEPSFYVEPISARGTVYVFGGGHVSHALVPLIKSVNFRVAVYDHRRELANAEKFPLADEIYLGSFLRVHEKITIRPDDYVVIMTPGHEADREVLAQALQTEATYIGCIGSRSKIAATNAYLLSHGISEERLKRVHAPIGLPILAETPAEIAVSVAAELIEHRARKNGVRK
ncbi:MAG: XdhC family protein [Clostridiales bacterium]|nr:XdhC family protein [Clostridiales bacterium]